MKLQSRPVWSISSFSQDFKTDRAVYKELLVRQTNTSSVLLYMLFQRRPTCCTNTFTPVHSDAGVTCQHLGILRKCRNTKTFSNVRRMMTWSFRSTQWETSTSLGTLMNSKWILKSVCKYYQLQVWSNFCFVKFLLDFDGAKVMITSARFDCSCCNVSIKTIFFGTSNDLWTVSDDHIVTSITQVLLNVHDLVNRNR